MAPYVANCSRCATKQQACGVFSTEHAAKAYPTAKIRTFSRIASRDSNHKWTPQIETAAGCDDGCSGYFDSGGCNAFHKTGIT
jgi:hypothetical protein